MDEPSHSYDEEFESPVIQYIGILEKGFVADEASPQIQSREEMMSRVKELLRLAFMTNELASEEDFERLFPRFLDEVLIEHAKYTYLATRNAVRREHEDEAADLDL